MNRVGVFTIVLAAAVAAACGGADSASSSPTAPSSPTASSQPAPASCVPANLRVVRIQGTVVTLEWNAVSGASEYQVLVGSAPSSADRVSTNTSNPNYTWTASPGRQYARVQAKCGGVFGGSSNEVDFTVAG